MKDRRNRRPPDRSQDARSERSFRPRNARELALAVLREAEAEDGFVVRRLEAALAASDLSPPDRRLTTELVFGVVRRAATLDALLRQCVKRPASQVEEDLWTILRLGAYQLVFLTSIPPHAAVHATVELAQALGEPRWKGFANGVLRGVGRLLSDEQTEEPGPRAIPLQEGKYRLAKEPIFADPASQFAEWFAQAFSFPGWLSERWQARFDREELLHLGFWYNTPPRFFLRVNLLQGSREESLAELRSAGIEAEPGALPESICLAGPVRVDDLPGFAEGRLTIQDESAMHAARLLAPQPGERVLDLCSAPGGKTTHLAELMQNTGYILAADIRADRLKRVTDVASRLGIGIIEPLLLDAELSNLPAEPFDAALVDVPCSNTGVLAKRPEARWRIAPSDLRELPALQKRLLRRAVEMLRPGGRVVYSTCSIEPEENEQVVAEILAADPSLQLVEERHHLPGRPADGGYQALLRKSE